MPDPGGRPWVRSERRGRTALLWIDHPPVNVLSRGVLEDLVACLREVDADPEARVVVLASACEKAFGAGADIREMESLNPTQAHDHAGFGQQATRAIERLPLPVIAAVHGACLGGGCEVALACDFILASEDARFGQPEINLGVMPGWGGTRRLPRRIGAARARRWILTGESVTAPEALTQGLLDRVVPRSELLRECLSLADQLAAKAPVALAAAKFALLHAIDPGVDEGMAYELDLWARLFGTAGQRDGMRSFLAKQPYASGGRTNWDAESRGFPWAAEPGSRPRGKGDKAGVPK